MKINSDFKEMLSVFDEAKVRYLIVGGYAVGFHVEPRFTKHLDLRVSTEDDNPERVFSALARFGAPMAGVTADDFAKPGTVFQLGVPPNRIDVLNELSGGQSFEDAWKNRVESNVDGVPIQIIGVEELLHNKVAVGRAQDIQDARALKRLIAKRKKA
jgi:predicted nucleotidyltransferase